MGASRLGEYRRRTQMQLTEAEIVQFSNFITQMEVQRLTRW